MIILEIKAIPGAGICKISIDKLGVLKCYLKNQAEDGKANKELLKLLSDRLDVPKACIEIIGGLSSRKKRIKIDRALTLAMIYHKLGVEMQKTIQF